MAEIANINNQIGIINKALLQSVWLYPGELDIETAIPNNFRNAIVIIDNDGEYEFYISSNISGTYEWVKISSGGSKTLVVDDYDELLTITKVSDGMLAVVKDTNDLYYYNETTIEWELLNSTKLIPIEIENDFEISVSHIDKGLRCSSDDDIVCTIPNDTSNIPIGSLITLQQAGVGNIIIEHDGTTITLNGYNQTNNEGELLQLWKTDETQWDVIGGKEEEEEITQNYRIVDTIEERDELPNVEEGMLVFVTSLRTEYRWDGEEWVVNSYQLNEDETEEDATYYVSPDGSDVLGDGTEINPWETIHKALVSIPSIIKHNTNIYLLSGDNDNYEYDFDSNINSIITKLTILEKVRFFGELELVTNEYTATGAPDINNPISIKLDNDKTFDMENQYLGYFFKYNNSVYPLGPHGLDDVTLIQFSSRTIKLNNGIYKSKTTMNVNENLPINQYGGYVNLHEMVVNIDRGRQSKYNGVFQRCVVKLKQNQTLESVQGKMLFNNSVIISNNTNQPTINISNDGTIRLGTTIIYNENGSASRSSAININNILNLEHIAIVGFAYAFSTSGNTMIQHNNAYHLVVINNCGSLFQIMGSGFQWNKASVNVTALEFPRLYLNNVNYLFALNAGSGTKLNNINVNLGDGYLQNELDIIQPFVTSGSRQWAGGNNLSTVSLTPIPKNLIDVERNINIVFPNSFGNIENMGVDVVSGDAMASILLSKTTMSNAIKINYTATSESGDIEIGTLSLTNKVEFDEDNNEINQIYRETVFDDIGLTFEKEIIDEDIYLHISNSKIGEDIHVEMDIRRYQIDQN